MVGCLRIRTRVHKQSMIVPYFDFANALKFYYLWTWALDTQAIRTKDTESNHECKDQESIQLSVPNLIHNMGT